MTQASAEILDILQDIIGVCDMTNPEHPKFRDSGADCIQELLEIEPRIRKILGQVHPGDNPYIGANCSACGEPQFSTPHGDTCSNGHGGARPA